MSAPEPPSVEEIRALAERGFALLARFDESRLLDDDRSSAFHALYAGETALQHAACLAALRGDVALLPLVREIALRLVVQADEKDHESFYVVGHALAELVKKSEVDGLVRELALHPSATIRVPLVLVLTPDTPARVALLRELARDPVSFVRDQARSHLGPDRLAPWWDTLFEVDPVPRLPARGRTGAEAALRTLAELYDPSEPRYKDASPAMADAVDALPTPLLLEASRRMLRGEVDGRLQAEVLPRLLARPGAEAVLVWLYRGWGYEERAAADHVIITLRDRLSRPRRRALTDAMLEVVRAGLGADPEDLSLERSAVDLARALLPPGGDPTPFFDLALAYEASDDGWGVAQQLLRVFERKDLGMRRVRRRITDAMLGPDGSAWRVSSYARHVTLPLVPAAVVRAFAMRFLTHEDDSRAKWAVETLVGRGYVRAEDGPRLDVVARLFADDRLRPFVPAERAVSLLRRRLRDGAASFEEAARTLTTVDSLWGGLAHEDSDQAQGMAAALRGRFTSTLGARALRGPITDEEWARYREASAATPPVAKGDLALAVLCIPPGPRSARDDATIELATERVLEEGAAGLLYALLEVIPATPCPADVARLERLAERCERRRRVDIKIALGRVVAALGLPTSRVAARAPDDDDDWLEQDDDDDD